MPHIGEVEAATPANARARRKPDALQLEAG
jgi:hypothetical protein